MSGPVNIFDRETVRRHRARAAAAQDGHDFLFAEVGERLLDRLDDIKRSFPLALDLGCRNGVLARLLKGRGGTETLVQCDLSLEMVQGTENFRLVADEEFLPFAPASFDLVLSNLALHWVNDLPGTLIQIRRALKPDGLFLGAMLGGETLFELRQSLAAAEIEVEDGISPRVSPLADIRDMGNLLQRAGFALPVTDMDTLTVSYADPLKLMHDLRAMGESNSVGERRKTLTRRATLIGAARRYRELFGDDDGRVPATFQIIYLAAWAPDPSQQKPLKPGSARSSLADALGAGDIPSGEKPRP